ncbi:MAG: amino acid ABC transporter permease [Betaproteobacteria bacterium]
MLDVLLGSWQFFLIGQYPNGPVGGLALTIALSVLGLVLSFPFSILIALARTSPMAIFRVPALVLVYAVRGIPLIMLIFWAYFVVPLIVGRAVPGFTTMVCTLVVYESVYLSDVIRAGIQALPAGQTEAARSLGLSYLRTVWYVIMPQALYNMVPGMVSQFVSIIKETSLASVISVHELTYSANQINASLLTKPLQVYLILALTYFVLCFALSSLARYLENRVTRKRNVTLVRLLEPGATAA